MNATLARFPLTIGSHVLSVMGRAGQWGVAHFLRAPMAASGVVLMAGLSLSAAANALYLQDTVHPAPLFGTPTSAPRTVEPIPPVIVEPEAIPQRPASAASAPSATPTSVESQAPMTEMSSSSDPAETSESTDAAQAIGNQDIADLQRKLGEMGFFEGTVDGYYGPKTADAIRAFEAQAGLPRTGAATPEVIEAVMAAPVTQAQAEPAPAPAVAASVQIETDSSAEVLLGQMQQEAQPATTVQTVARAPAPAPEAVEPPTAAATAPTSIPPALDEELVREIQRGLSRLGFLQAPVNGVADEATAKAIRKFQIFNNFAPTGEVSPTVRQMLVSAGAYL